LKRFTEFKDFYGGMDCGVQLKAFGEALRLAVEIRQRLGGKGYLLETYVSSFLDAAQSAYSASSDYLHAATRDLDALIANALDGRRNDNPFYLKTIRFIWKHPLGNQERATKFALYRVALFQKYLRSRARDRRAFFRERLLAVLDHKALDQLRREIDGIVGQKPMDKLARLLRQGFLPSTQPSAFMQETTATLIRDLTRRDEVTGRFVFSLWLDTVVHAAFSPD